MLRASLHAVDSWWRTHPRTVDAFLGLGLIGIGVVSGPGVPSGSLTGNWWILGLGSMSAVLIISLRRSHPYLCWAGTVALVPALQALNLLMVPGDSPSHLLSVFSFLQMLGNPLIVGTIATLRSPGRAWGCSLVSAVSTVSTVTLGSTALLAADWSLTSLAYPVSFYMLLNALGVLVGTNLRTQRERLAEAEERSTRLALAREQTATLAAANERSRIAREMHDVVAHSLAVMITMADGAAASVDRNPAMVKQALEVLSETGRSALADTRRLVGVLRDDPGASSAPQAHLSSSEDNPVPSPTAPLRATGAVERPDTLHSDTPHSGTTVRRRRIRPQPPSPATTGPIPVVRDLPVPEFAPPGTVAPAEPSEPIVALRQHATDARTDTSTGETPMAPAPEQADLEVLVNRFVAAGVPVTYRWQGAPLPADKSLQLTLFRIAQEAMTNILRYAPTTRFVNVEVSRHTGTVVLVVDNEAAPGSTPVHGSGKGLIGMRERAAVYGGTVQTGPTQTGWRVRAVLRWDEDDEGTSPWQTPL